jgi:glycosyltransferase involved in cell wall biosynthesis
MSGRSGEYNGPPNLDTLNAAMKPIVQISPTYYDRESVVGGGERYVHELSRFLGRRYPVVLVTFGKRRETREMEGYRMEIYPAIDRRFGFTVGNPFAMRFLREISGSAVVHVHQISTMVGDLACLAARFCGRRVFVTDHGGGGGRLLQTRVPVTRCYTAAIAQSEYARGLLEGRKTLSVVSLPGGVDLEFYRPDSSGVVANRILFLGRMLPHKGVHVLLRAFAHLKDLGAELVVAGRPYDADYYAELQQLAKGLNVSFRTDAEDGEIRQLLASSRVTVVPSVHDPAHGGVSELMGFTSLESQACGTPVVVSDAGALAEFVDSGGSGVVVPQGRVEALADAIRVVVEAGHAMRTTARTWVEQFGWETVARSHLELYAIKGSPC